MIPQRRMPNGKRFGFPLSELRQEQRERDTENQSGWRGGIPSLKLKGKASLAPMLAMLKGLYEESKSRIAQQNTREEKSKKWFTAKEAEHKAKMETIEGKFK